MAFQVFATKIYVLNVRDMYCVCRRFLEHIKENKWNFSKDML